MTEAGDNRVDEFLHDLEGSLKVSGDQAREIVDEVRGDLWARVEDLKGKGQEEAEAVAAVLKQIGNPYELSHHIGHEVTPRSNPIVRHVRSALAICIMGWAAWFAWVMRGWSYGFPFPVYGMSLGLFFSVGLLVWPGIVWRKNWMFGLVPAGFGILLFLFGLLGGTSSSQRIDPGVPAPIEADASGALSPRAQQLVGGGLLCLLGALLAAMQQRRQRRWVMGMVAVGLLAVELPYQVEEGWYRHRRVACSGWLEAFRGEYGQLPSRDELAAKAPELASAFRYSPNPEGDAYSLIWTRPLSRGFAIGWSSDDGRIWIND